MIEHEIKLDIDTKPVQLVQVVLADQLFIKIIVNDRKPTVEVAMKKRGQNIEERKSVLHFGTLEEFDDVG
jgi:hypothetical protein